VSRWGLDRWILISGIVATVGMQYRTFQTQSETIKKLQANEETLSDRYVPREVYRLNNEHLTESINELTQAVKALTAERRGTGTTTAPLGRMFDR
jgi:Tfp pilus assembly protein PilO